MYTLSGSANSVTSWSSCGVEHIITFSYHRVETIIPVLFNSCCLADKSSSSIASSPWPDKSGMRRNGASVESTSDVMNVHDGNLDSRQELRKRKRRLKCDHEQMNLGLAKKCILTDLVLETGDFYPSPIHSNGVSLDLLSETLVDPRASGTAGSISQCESFKVASTEAPSSGVREYKPKSASLGRTDSSCSSNRRDESDPLTQQNRLFQQLQKQRVIYLADLWDILGKFKAQVNDHVDDASVIFIIQYNVDILQRMIAPMVAPKKMLASWLTEHTLDKLKRQIHLYLETFKAEKFQSSFDRLVARPAQVDVWAFLAKPGYEKKPSDCHHSTSAAADDEQDSRGKEVWTEAAKFVTLSGSESEKYPDPGADSVKETSRFGHAPSRTVSAVKEAATLVFERNHHETRYQASNYRCVAVQDFGPQSKRLKMMNNGEQQEEGQNETSPRENHELADHFSPAKVADDVVRQQQQQSQHDGTRFQDFKPRCRAFPRFPDG